MFRKPKSYSGRNNSSIESEYSQEQTRVETIKNRRDQIAEHRRVVLYGSSEEKANLKFKIGQDASLLLYIREQKAQEEREIVRRESEAMENHRLKVVEMERRREEEKRERLRLAQEANRIAAIDKKNESLEKKVYQDLRDRKEIHDNIYKYQPNVF